MWSGIVMLSFQATFQNFTKLSTIRIILEDFCHAKNLSASLFFFFTIRKYSFTPQGFSEQIVKAIYFTSLKMFRYFFSTFQFLWFLYNSVIHNMTNFHFVFNSKPLWILYKGLYDQIWVICAITSWSKFLISHVNLSYLWYHLIHSLISISI